MSDTPNEFETDPENEQEPSKLRQIIRQHAAERKQLLEKLAAFESAEVQRSVKVTWDELNVPAPIRDFYKGEQTPDAMKQWWEASKGFFNIEAGEEAPVTEQPSEQELAQRQAAQQFQDASSLGTNAIHSGFDAIKAEAANVAAAFRAGRMSRADYDAAVTKLNEGMNTPAY